ncbi:pentatricopeptide repeat-containing protein At4g20740-like [Telopea speciosissima]|uniref:pentatricopeptide repeat-containing protein At4g20740-like n=1 Tax=Telopea speciosissima TaxID=54955 RepID=UPI001CC644E2|nr:pentatricopeptide repeat-containing protein At4g20740-like [Telopea speciosissima]
MALWICSIGSWSSFDNLVEFAYCSWLLPLCGPRSKGTKIIVLGILFDARRVGLACDLLKDRMESGYRADLSIYNSLIKGLCNVDQVDKAYKLLQITVQEGLSHDFVTINPILMKKLGYPVIHDLSKFFSFLIEKGNTELTALQVFTYLKEKGYSSVTIYNILIGALHSIRDIKEALSLFNEMKNSDVGPDSSTYSNIIPCFIEIGDLKEAWLHKIGEIDAAIVLVHDCLANVMSGPMEFKYTLTILHVCRSGDADKVIEVLNEMMPYHTLPKELNFKFELALCLLINVKD